VETPDDKINPQNYERTIGDSTAVHIGLSSRVDRLGFPDGYELALATSVVERLSKLGEIYGLRLVGMLGEGGFSFRQPTEFSKLEAALMAGELRWLQKVTIDPVVVDAAYRLDAIAEECKSSGLQSEKLAIRFT
jgi:hypothetical protein